MLSVPTFVFELLGQQQSGDQGKGHHEHGDVGWTQVLLRQPHQAAAPQQQTHVKIQIAQLHQADALQERHTQARQMLLFQTNTDKSANFLCEQREISFN